MPVETRQPQIQVILHKNVGRAWVAGSTPVSERFRGQAKRIDLSRWLGELGGVTVTKSVRAPAGSFSIQLTGMINDDVQDSIYGLVEPMDMVEIRMVGNGHIIGQNGGFPMMMRGFVGEPSKGEVFGPDGKPQRSVTITGHDYGKIWQIYQIFNMPNLPTGEALLSSFPFFQQFGVAMNIMTAQEFVQEIVDKVLNPYIVNIGGQGLSQSDNYWLPLLPLKTDISIDDGVVMPFSLGGWNGGSIYALLMQYCDVGPWNELFIEDRDDGPYLVCRPNPFMDVDTKQFILPQKNPPAIIDITRSDVVLLNASRSDADVANYFWVDAPTYSIARPEVQRMAAYQGDPESFYVTQYGNVNPLLYGRRKMWEQTQQGNPAESCNGNGQPAGPQRDADNKSATEWIAERRRQLIEQNKDNVVLERGVMRLKGNHAISAGKYVRLTRGRMISSYYAVQTVHDYKPFGNYFTTVNFERGTGFVDRVQMANPYYGERAK